MRVKTIQILTYSELSDTAKETARNWYRQCGDCYYSGDENVESLKRWAAWFHVKISNYSLGGSDNRSQGVQYDVIIDDNAENLSGVRLWKWLNNQFMLPKLDGNCPFTGYCFDENLLNPIREFMKRPGGQSYADLMWECVESFVSAYAADVDYSYSDEAVEENILGNEYEFDEYGNHEG